MMSFTLLTFTNSFPDMVTSILMAKDKEEGPLFSIAGLFATLIFQTTATIAYVIYNSDKEVQVDKKFFFKEILSASLISLIFLGFGLAGWISGIVIVIFLVLYVGYVMTSYLLARSNTSLPPKATINFDICNGTIDNLDFDNKLLFSSNKEQPKVNTNQTGMNFISVDRNSLTPQIEKSKKWGRLIYVSNVKGQE